MSVDVDGFVRADVTDRSTTRTSLNLMAGHALIDVISTPTHTISEDANGFVTDRRRKGV